MQVNGYKYSKQTKCFKNFEIKKGSWDHNKKKGNK